MVAEKRPVTSTFEPTAIITGSCKIYSHFLKQICTISAAAKLKVVFCNTAAFTTYSIQLPLLISYVQSLISFQYSYKSCSKDNLQHKIKDACITQSKAAKKIPSLT